MLNRGKSSVPLDLKDSDGRARAMELARKARQQEKQQRRAARPSAQSPETSQLEASGTPRDPTSGSAT